MTKQFKWFHDALDLVKQAGGEILKLRTNRTFFAQIRINSYTFGWAVSKTPSTPTAIHDALRDLKRELRKAGVSPMPEFAIKMMTRSEQKPFDLRKCLAGLQELEASIDQEVAPQKSGHENV